MAKIIPSGCTNIVKTLPNQCSRTENALTKVVLEKCDNSNHPCPVCGSSETLNGSQNYEMSPVHVEFFHDLIFALRVEVGGGGGGGGDNPRLNKEDVQNFICEKCITKFVMLESLQREIAQLENKVEEILSQLRKTIRDRQRVISQRKLTVPVTKPEATVEPPSWSDVDEEDVFETSIQMTAEAENDEDDEDVEWKPVILEDEIEEDEVQEVPNELPDDEEGDGLDDDQFEEADSISEEQPMNVADQGDLDLLSPKKSRRCKVRAANFISAIIRYDDSDNIDDDDDSGNDEYSPKNESDVDSDDTNELESDSDTPQNKVKRHYKHKGARTLSDSDNTSELESDSDTPRSKVKRHYKQSGARITSEASPKAENQDDKHICELCGAHAKHLTEHMKTHNRSDEKKKVACETCHKTFPTQSLANVHMKQFHLKQFRYICEKCGQRYQNPKRLQVHLNRQTSCTGLVKERKISCPLCKAVGFSSKHSLRHHTRRVHKRDKRIPCPHQTCKTSFCSETNLQNHLNLYHPDKIICTICDKEFSTAPERLAHIKSSHTCKFCDKSFPKKADLDEHKETHHSGDRPYVCAKCGLRFNRKKALTLHLQITYCNPDRDEMAKARWIRNRKNYKSKRDFPSKRKPHPLKCDFCEKTYPIRKSLFLHISRCHRHEETDKISCTMCNEQFQTILQQEAHIESSHHCRFCNTSFSKKADLEEHKTTHTGDEPYLCSKCGNKFRRLESLKRHLKMTVCNPDKAEMLKARKFRNTYRREWFAKRKSSKGNLPID